MVLSKSTYNSIVLWMPKIPGKLDKIIADKAAYSPPSDVIALRTFNLDDCEIWFVRFTIDRTGKLLAAGNMKGDVDIWDIDECSDDASKRLKSNVDSTIRMLSFSPNGRVLVGCNDHAHVFRWDC